MDNSTRTVLEAAFPEREVSHITEMTESGHPGNQTLRVQFTDGDHIFLKVRVDNGTERNEREAATLQYARSHCDVRVPSVMAADSTFSPPYLATEPIEGTPLKENWGTPNQREAVATDIGRAVAGLTIARFDDHGWITGGSERQLEYESGEWNMVLAEAIERDATEITYPDRFDDAPRRVADLLRDSADILNDASSALVHQDVHPDNVFRNHQLGVIDWEWTLIGDPGLCLCWGEEWIAERADVTASDKKRLRTAIRNGYREEAGQLPSDVDRRRPIYQVVTFLPKARTFDHWAPAASEPTDELADWVLNELTDRIAAAETVT